MARSLFFSSLLVAGLAVGGQAQAQSTAKWTGFYAGVHGGYHWSESRQSATPGGDWVGDPDWPAISAQVTRNLNLDGFNGGVQAGYNLQSGNIVYGLEVDATWLDASSSYQTPTFPGLAAGTWNAAGSASIDWLTTIRGRLGVTSGNALFYGTLGLAIADTKFSQRISYVNVVVVPELPLTNAAGGQNSGSSSNLQYGLAAGGGLEFKLDRSWSVKAEYLYVNLGKESATSTFTSPINAGVYTVNHHNNFNSLNLVRLGLNYNFN